MTNEPPDDQMTFDITDMDDDDQLDLQLHEPVTKERVEQIIELSWDDHFTNEANHEILVKLLEPLPWECEIIEKVVRDWCKTN